MNFWATWCGPCRLEIPELVSVDAARPRAARIVGVSLDSDSEAVRRFVRAHGLSYQVVMGTETILGSFPDLTGIPTTFVVDGRAEIVARFLGPVERSALLKAVGDPRGSRRE